MGVRRTYGRSVWYKHICLGCLISELCNLIKKHVVVYKEIIALKY
jgi:hypothetical protein